MTGQDDSKTSTEFVVETHNLSKKYKDVQAVDNLNMKVRKGEIFGFLGPNGAGKTTTIKMLMSLAHPSGGDVCINGKRIDGDSIQIRKEVGYMPERVAFYDNLTALQTLHFFCELKGADKSIAKPLLDEVGLGDTINQKVGTFSKGMTQLLGFAQAMIGKPSIYILDEPTAGLDARWLKVARDKIKKLNEEGATIIFSSHILTEVQSLCDRVAIINKGRLVADDSVLNLSKYLNIKPRLEITIEGLNGRVPDSVLKIGGVEGAEAKENVLFVTCDAASRLDVITTLKKKGLDIRDFKTIEPSLEEVFIKLTSGEKEGA